MFLMPGSRARPLPQLFNRNMPATQRGWASHALQQLSPPQGRLTLTSNVAVPTTTVSGATTVYYTPAVGNQVPIYDGTNFVPTFFSQLSQATTDTTKSPAAVAASSVYDIFVWNDGGTIRATRGPAWTNDTTRSAGTALTVTNGISLNSVAITNGPAALRGTYVGTIRSNGSSTIDFIFGTTATGGGAAVFYVWNAYNQALFQTAVADNTTSWTYSGSPRAADNSTANRISFVTGAATNAITAKYQIFIQSPATADAFIYQGFGLDSTTVFSAFTIFWVPTAHSIDDVKNIPGLIAPQLGAHFFQAIEAGDGTNTFTMFGSLNGSTGVQNMILSAELWA